MVKKTPKMNREDIIACLKHFGLDYERQDIENKTGVKFTITTKGYENVIVNSYDTGSYNVQGKNPSGIASVKQALADCASKK